MFKKTVRLKSIHISISHNGNGIDTNKPMQFYSYFLYRKEYEDIFFRVPFPHFFHHDDFFGCPIVE